MKFSFEECHGVALSSKKSTTAHQKFILQLWLRLSCLREKTIGTSTDNHHSERLDSATSRVHYSNARLMEFRGLSSRLLPDFFVEMILNLESLRRNHRQSKYPNTSPPKLISLFSRSRGRQLDEDKTIFVYLRRDECSQSRGMIERRSK